MKQKQKINSWIYVGIAVVVLVAGSIFLLSKNDPSGQAVKDTFCDRVKKCGVATKTDLDTTKNELAELKNIVEKELCVLDKVQECTDENTLSFKTNYKCSGVGGEDQFEEQITECDGSEKNLVGEPKTECKAVDSSTFVKGLCEAKSCILGEKIYACKDVKIIANPPNPPDYKMVLHECAASKSIPGHNGWEQVSEWEGKSTMITLPADWSCPDWAKCYDLNNKCKKS